ncbi:hypothetical protein BDZ89DRAFT_1146024 [Hymenopellis radicata]|nr:hypothetical protein BDZ89DRAFT_1146024 [Hymenopellis radicata]
MSLCFAPGKGLFVTEQQKELAFNEFMDSVMPETRACHLKTVVEFMESLKLSSFFMDGYWVSLLATDHAYKNHGFRTSIMERIKLRAAEENWQVGLVTHTEKNRDWYLGLGFDVAGVRRMSSKPYGDTFPCIAFKPYPSRE